MDIVKAKHNSGANNTLSSNSSKNFSGSESNLTKRSSRLPKTSSLRNSLLPSTDYYNQKPSFSRGNVIYRSARVTSSSGNSNNSNRNVKLSPGSEIAGIGHLKRSLSTVTSSTISKELEKLNTSRPVKSKTKPKKASLFNKFNFS